MSLTREQFLAAELPRKKVTLPDGGEVYVRTLTAAQREEWEACLSDTEGARAKGLIRASLVALTVCDEHGATLFTKADVPALAEKSAPVIIRLFEEASEFNSVTKADVNELEKN
ncbi:hypothetical protein SAMN05444166_1870 [Singulisphaera sp. GP187]|uniref:hypothetical protein n=1 Tax=Singulisphaera sp. GP187 TaxID=1882752 RepID=UPI00092CA48A|nr:hypothetical protein [Singulisphaera sp. GP187]SIN97628.1 hypothetical protein SAMN05444166_1870 [Singulisphaera sp. GP187]